MNKHEDGGHQRRQDNDRRQKQWSHTKILLGVIFGLLFCIAALVGYQSLV